MTSRTWPRNALRSGTALLVAMAASWAGNRPAKAGASRAVAVLQGQSNAYFMADEANGGGWYSVFPNVVKGLTGIPQVDVYAEYNGGVAHTIASGTATYNSATPGGDASLWLLANSATPSAWPLTNHGTSCANYLNANINGKVGNAPVGFFRFHSEDDTKKSGADASYYADANRNFIARMRSAANLSPAQMPVFYGSPAFWSGVNPQGLNSVRAAWLAEINNRATNSHWAFGAVSDCFDRNDASHMDAQGDKQAAARMAFSYARWLYDNGYSNNDLSKLPRLGPRIVRFDRVSGAANQVNLTIVHDGGTDIVIPANVRLDGFSISDSGGELQPTGAARINATKLRLTLPRNLNSGAVSLDYLQWNGFYGAGNLITDNWHTSAVSKPSYVSNTVNAYFPGLKMPLRRLQAPLSIGVTASTSPDDQPPTSNALADGTYTLTPSCATNARMDASLPGTTQGSKVQIWDATNASNQTWRVTGLGSGFYRVEPSYVSGLALDVNGASTQPGATVQLWTSNSTNAQKWQIAANADSTYTLHPACALALSLDVPGGVATNGTGLITWTDNGNPNQRWTFTRVP